METKLRILVVNGEVVVVETRDEEENEESHDLDLS